MARRFRAGTVLAALSVLFSTLVHCQDNEVIYGRRTRKCSPLLTGSVTEEEEIYLDQPVCADLFKPFPYRLQCISFTATTSTTTTTTTNTINTNLNERIPSSLPPPSHHLLPYLFQALEFIKTE
ncbi:hypothetical protein E2C01_065479 [Portunus trituberculatus]|uniref:Uncharacterized protein n=1 Tax=Portunus trituberculatus TaxID=210409 RepID=A0A5B7HR73_PORTR|nr:hypothetical protein [Portunus trituberculatus]